MSQVSDLGNNVGFIYEVDLLGNIICSNVNTIFGLRCMLQRGAINAPLGAGRSAVSLITITAVAGVGAFSAVNVSGINQITPLVNVTTSNPATEAANLAAAINALTPGAGPDYTAFSIGNIVYLVEPVSVAGQSNGILPVVSVTDASIVTTVTAFAGGAPPAGSYDGQFGRKYYLNATAISVPNSIVGATDVTKYITLRPISSNMPEFTYTLSTNQLTFIDRYSVLTTVLMLNEGAAARDTLEFINPFGFIQDDILYLEQKTSAQSQDIISAPNSLNPKANIYLTGNNDFPSDNHAILQVKYEYDSVLGSIFREIGRSNPTSIIKANRNKTIYVDATHGDDATGTPDDFLKPYQTIDAAVAASSAVYTIEVSAGTYAGTTNLCPHSDMTVYLRDATVTGNNLLGAFGANSRIIGNGNITTNAFAQNCLNVYIECNNLTIEVWYMQSSTGLTVDVKDTLTIQSYMSFATGASNVRLKWNKAIFSNINNVSGLSCIQWLTRFAGSTVFCDGDVYVTGNYNTIFYCSSNNIYQQWNGKLFIATGAAIGAIYGMLDNLPSLPQYRFRTKAEIYSPENRIVLNTSGNSVIEFSGKIFCPSTASPVANANRASSGINLPSYIYMTNAEVYAEGTLNEILHLEDTASRFILDDVSLYSMSAVNCIQGAVAGCKYQSKGVYSNKPKGANAAQELNGTFPDISIDSLMK